MPAMPIEAQLTAVALLFCIDYIFFVYFQSKAVLPFEAMFIDGQANRYQQQTTRWILRQRSNGCSGKRGLKY